MEYIKPSKRKSEKRNSAIRRQRKLDNENIWITIFFFEIIYNYINNTLFLI
jgi:hypothetical protein